MKALTLVARKGPPTFFITATCNPLWPEIVEQLLPGQTAYDRDDLTCRVFHARLQALLHNLRQGHYFEGRTTTYSIYVIEFQHRGLPHAHIVLQLDGAPDHNDHEVCIAFIDRFISSEMPVDNPNSTEEDRLYAQYVSDFMVHKCSTGAVNSCCDEDGNCSKGYSSDYSEPFTHFDEKGYPIYARPLHKDRMVVPHNREILLDWEGHINVEYCASTYAIIYLFKYLMKGNKKVVMFLNNLDDVDEDDEIKIHLRGRMLSSTEAFWRIMDYNIYPSTTPGVKAIKLKMPQDLARLQLEGKVCDLDVYFRRPNSLSAMTYIAFFEWFNHSYNCPSWAADAEECSIENLSGNREMSAIDFEHLRKVVYLVRLQSEEARVVRLGGVPFNCGEPYYFRLLLKNLALRSFREAKIFGHQTFDTFQEACEARGLSSYAEEAMNCFEEAMNEDHLTPYTLRSLFVQLTIGGFPTVQIFNRFKEQLGEDLAQGNNTQRAYEALLQDLQIRFLNENKMMESYGLPKPNTGINLLEKERQFIADNIENSKQKLQNLHVQHPNTDEMVILYNKITRAIDRQQINDSPKYFAIDALGGSGNLIYCSASTPIGTPNCSYYI